jgi:tetracycline resistance efflux pump
MGDGLGPMLIAERKTQVFNRTDGGDGKTHGSGLGEKHNQPEANTPGRIWNMIIPICVLVILIIALLIESGEEPGVEQTLIDKLQNSNSYKALLYGTAAAVLLTLLMYHFQFKTDGEDVLWPTPNVLKAYVTGWCKKEDHDGARRVAPLMNVYESVDSFLYGMGHVFPATVVLTLAWASGSIMGAVGTDRLFADIISDGVAPGSLPTLSFVISFFMALATGTSWGTMVRQSPLNHEVNILFC